MQLSGERTISWSPTSAMAGFDGYAVTIGKDTAGSPLEIVVCIATQIRSLT